MISIRRKIVGENLATLTSAIKGAGRKGGAGVAKGTTGSVAAKTVGAKIGLGGALGAKKAKGTTGSVAAKTAGGVGNKYKIAVHPVKSGFLKFSHKVDYGLFLMTELAKRQPFFNSGVIARHTAIAHLLRAKANHVAAPISLREISEENQMSFFFMQKAAFDLRKAGLITSGRGKKGGYTLAKPANQISLKEILEALEGPLKVMDCLGDNGVWGDSGNGSAAQTCVRESSCNMRGGLDIVNSIIINSLAKTKLSDLFKN